MPSTRLVAAGWALAVPALAGHGDPAIDFSNYSFRLGGSVITPDPSITWGTWEGWGVSLCWWANVFGDREDLADALFTLQDEVSVEGATLPGLGLTIARYNAGGSGWKATSEGETMVSARNIPPWKQIAGLWENYESQDASSDSWNWTADVKQRSMLLMARDRGADHFELFSNSPMWWMLYNHNPSGHDFGQENLQSWNQRNHSIYLADLAAHAKENWGIHFDSVEPFNEPFTMWEGYFGNQEGCHFARSTQDAVVQELRQELDSRGLVDMIVTASDENTYDLARGSWNSFGDEAKAITGRVNVHGYQGVDGRRDLLFNDVAGKPLWNSEYSDGDESGLSMAKNLMLDFRWLHSTAYCYWQALDENVGWGLLKFDSTESSVQSPNTKYWVLAHYSRHIRPGMRILDNGGSEDVVVAYDDAKQVLVLIGMNVGDTIDIAYDLSAFGEVSGPVTRWVTETGDAQGERYVVKHADLVLKAASLVVPFKERSVQTIEIQNVRLSAMAIV